MSHVEVKSIKKDSLAERIGLQIGDILLSYDGTCILAPRELPQRIEEAKEKNKETVEFILLRGDEEVKYTVPPQKLGFVINSISLPDTPAETDSNSATGNAVDVEEKVKVLPPITIIFLVLAGGAFFAGMILCINYWPANQYIEPRFSIICFVGGFIEAALFAAIGMGLFYLRNIAESILWLTKNLKEVQGEDQRED